MKSADWLGNEYGVGDLVVYGAGSGRSITMVLGRVVDMWMVFNSNKTYKWERVPEGEPVPEEASLRVQIQPLKSSRWKQHYGKTRYIDMRSGKGIDPFIVDKKTGFYRHMDGGYFENTETGDRVHEYEYRRIQDSNVYRYWDVPSTPEGWVQVRAEFKSYVQEVKQGPGLVTLLVTENIVKWDGK